MSARKITPAPKRLAGYPRLKAAWRLLLGAAPLAFPSLAHADATVPGPGPQQSGKNQPVPKPQKQPKPTRVVPRLMGDYSPPEPPSPPPAPPPPKVEKPREESPRVKGGPAKPRRPTVGTEMSPFTFYLSADGDHDLVLHPHGPDEPCIHFELPSSEEA
jgi:hypothetical protein